MTQTTVTTRQLSPVANSIIEALRNGWEVCGESCDGPYSLRSGSQHTKVPSRTVEALVERGFLTVISTWRTQFYVLTEEQVPEQAEAAP